MNYHRVRDLERESSTGLKAFFGLPAEALFTDVRETVQH